MTALQIIMQLCSALGHGHTCYVKHGVCMAMKTEKQCLTEVRQEAFNKLRAVIKKSRNGTRAKLNLDI